IFSMPYILAETLLLLTSSFTCGMAMLYARKKQKNIALYALVATFLLGLSFLLMELYEFRQLVIEGHSWRQSAFLSSYFTLVGTHGLHITVGLFWMIVVSYQIYKKGIQEFSVKRLALLSLFWHFLDIIWIFIFTVVYLMGVI
ncbi:MAG: cytochrome o ubiquinol oxidase subunit III, partial [Bacteroidetes bacterium]|nr:cytochrome o ubiquinol oxidase subunit III [Bacteroidota bacterium]